MLIDRLDQYMKKMGLNKHQLAVKSGIPYQTIVSLFKRGSEDIKLSTVKKLADFFECTVDDLIGENGNTYIRHLPVVSRFLCSEGAIVYEDIVDYQTVPKDWVADGEYFFLRAKGNDMTGIRIHDGDLLLVRRQDTVENGQTAVVLVEHETLVRRVYRKEGVILLMPENPKYVPFVFKNNESVNVIGKVVKIIIGAPW